MHYYLDGYNMLFRNLHAGENLQSQRETLINDLATKINLLEIDATLVFDSHYRPDEGSRSHVDRLEIVFTAVGKTADEHILQALKESPLPGQHTVVTSDKKLADQCRRRLSKTESVEEFWGWLNKRHKNKISLRKIKEPLAIPPPKPPVKELPKITTKPEECFDYYLEAFEKETQEIAKHPQKKLKSSLKSKPKQRPLTLEEEHLSNMERWEKAFEKKRKDEDDLFA